MSPDISHRLGSLVGDIDELSKNIEALVEEAWDQGKERGYDDGYADGLKKGDGDA